MIDFLDDITRFQAGPGGAATGLDLSDYHSLRSRVQLEALRKIAV